MKATKLLLVLFISALISINSTAQHLTQTIKGIIIDRESQSPLPGATVTIPGTEPLKATISDMEGYFQLEDVPVGRYDLSISFVGYQPLIMPEILLSTGKETFLNIELVESVEEIDEVTIKANTKDRPGNSMAMLSARTFSVEEASRYAGGFDDPARMASSFAGVATGSIQDNSIIVRGNSPKGLLWELEGVAIPNPNHFAGAISAGGGIVTIFSGQMLSNSDFFTGAFPAEYGNALAGVFDIKFRTGNMDKREYWAQAGVMGIDLGSEGPFVKGKKATYLFNYRYSTFGLLMPLFPEGSGLPAYQDLSYKLNFPTKNAGIFSFWGIGAIDKMLKNEETDPEKWESETDKEREETHMKPAATGLTHKYIIGNHSYINTTIAVTNYSGGHAVHRLDSQLFARKIQYIDVNEQKLIAQSFLNHKFNEHHTNRTGIIYTQMFYNIDLEATDIAGQPLIQYVNSKGNNYLLQGYTESKFMISNALNANLGVHAQYFGLNGNYSIEPRAGIKWNYNTRQAVSFGIGLHSQTEDLKIYMAKQGDELVNKDLDFTKALHIVLGYDLKINDNMRLKAETYYQYLYHVPVIADSTFSMINFQQQWFLNDALINKGKGTNYGIDLTLERFLKNGYYWLATASIFDSKYIDGIGIKRNTAFNRGVVANLLIGKEFYLNHHSNKFRILSINGKVTYLGGEKLIPLNRTASSENADIIYDYAKAYERTGAPATIANLTISFKKNKPTHTSTWSLQLLNFLGAPTSNYDFYNIKENKLDVFTTNVIVPNLSYKIEF